jgi:tetratricopeptide (TPR) repeat protein
LIRLSLLFNIFTVFFLTSCIGYTKLETVKKINIPIETSEREKSDALFIITKDSSSESKIKTREIAFRLNKYLADNGSVMNAEAISLVKDGRYTEAEIILSDLLNENPNDSCAANNLGVIFEFEGNFESSMNMYYRACSIDPDNSIYRKNFLTLMDTFRP